MSFETPILAINRKIADKIEELLREIQSFESHSDAHVVVIDQICKLRASLPDHDADVPFTQSIKCS